MRKPLFVILLIIFGSFTLLAQQSQTGLTGEEYEMISSILGNSSVIINETIPMKIVVGDKERNLTNVHGGVLDVFYLKESLPEISDEAMKDFISKNKKAYTLEKTFTLN